MKTKHILGLILITLPFLTFAGPDFNAIQGEVDSWKQSAVGVAKSIIGLAAVLGAIWVYFKMQSAEGGEGKKALMNYLGGLAFAALVWILIDAFLA